jgi:hypothetical protein
MPVNSLRYKLVNGYIDNWLVAGPIVHDELLSFDTEHLVNDEALLSSAVEPGSAEDGKFSIGNQIACWCYLHCQEDHYIDFSDDQYGDRFLSSWAYAQLRSNKPQDILLVITAYGSVEISIYTREPQQIKLVEKNHFTKTLPVHLDKGINPLLIKFSKTTSMPSPYTIAVRLCEREDEKVPLISVKVHLPTNIRHLTRRNELEESIQAAFTRRDIFPSSENVEVEWPIKMSRSAFTHARLQTPTGRVYVEATDKGKPGDKAFLNHSASLPEGPYDIQLMPVPREYYEENIRFSSQLPIWVVGNQPYSESDPKNYFERKVDALNNAALRDKNIFSEVAKMALGRWLRVDTKFLTEFIRTFSTFTKWRELLGLLGIMARYGQLNEFPGDLKGEITELVTKSIDWGCKVPISECDQILFFACKVVIGQLYPTRKINSRNITGIDLRREGEAEALNWMKLHCQYGFTAWDSDPVLSDTLIALSHLCDLAKSEQIYDLAGALLDKILIGIAQNSFCGGLASSSGQETNLSVKGIYGKASSGICRLLWGQGVYNHLLEGYTSLACMQNYELPLIIIDLALLKDEVWGKERHADRYKVTYRTCNGMLSSVQNYRPGERGNKEHIWQATLGPEAIVYVNHPGNSSQNNSHTPNYWLGNASLPKVVQWKDTLIAIYNLLENDWMGFTHAYFPISAFDEYHIQHNWAFGRKGDGYLAITASHRLDLMKNGQGAYRELRCQNSQVIWVCQLGNASLDQDFSTFQKRILKLPIDFKQLSLHFNTIRQEEISIGWDEPFTRNGTVESLIHNSHYEYNHLKADYPCHVIELQIGENLFRLNLT